MRYLYLALTPLTVLATLAHHLWRALRNPAYLARWHQRLGLGWSGVAPGCIWVSCVSLGEVRTAAPLVRRLLAETSHPLLLTATTPTGLAEIQRQFAGDAPRVQWRWTPLDSPLCVAAALRGRTPALYLALESELWPATLGQLRRLGVPAALANARLSDRSLGRVSGLLGRLLAPLLGGLDAVVARSEQDAQRLAAAGVRPQALHRAPELKFALQEQVEAARRGAEQLRDQLGLDDSVKLAVAGSTHAGEDSLVARAWQQAKPQGALLVVAPRHPEQFGPAERRLRELGLRVARHSQGAPPPDCQVLLLDALGILPHFYALASCVLVGGSLQPQLRGHNLAEAAAFGVPVCCGPHHANFRAMAAQLQELGALRILEDEGELAEFFRQTLDAGPGDSAGGGTGAGKAKGGPKTAEAKGGGGAESAVQQLGQQTLQTHAEVLLKLLASKS